MAEAVGLASGLLTLIIFAYDTSKSLYKAVSSFKSQRKTIKDVLADLDSLVTVFKKIHEQAQRSQEVERLKPLREPLNCCTTTCHEMHEMLDACTTHSKEGQDSVRDWLNMRYHKKSFEDMKKRLANFKSTLSIAFESINM
jgi:DNA repair ATPase RecN